MVASEPKPHTKALLGLKTGLGYAARDDLLLHLLGGAYLVFLGSRLWMIAAEPMSELESGAIAAPPLLKALFLTGLTTQITNPKTVLTYARVFGALLGPLQISSVVIRMFDAGSTIRRRRQRAVVVQRPRHWNVDVAHNRKIAGGNETAAAANIAPPAIAVPTKFVIESEVVLHALPSSVPNPSRTPRGPACKVVGEFGGAWTGRRRDCLHPEMLPRDGMTILTGTLTCLYDRKKFGNLGSRTGTLSYFPGQSRHGVCSAGMQAGRTAAGNGPRELQLLKRGS